MSIVSSRQRTSCFCVAIAFSAVQANTAAPRCRHGPASSPVRSQAVSSRTTTVYPKSRAGRRRQTVSWPRQRERIFPAPFWGSATAGRCSFLCLLISWPNSRKKMCPPCSADSGPGQCPLAWPVPQPFPWFRSWRRQNGSSHSQTAGSTSTAGAVTCAAKSQPRNTSSPPVTSGNWITGSASPGTRAAAPRPRAGSTRARP